MGSTKKALKVVPPGNEDYHFGGGHNPPKSANLGTKNCPTSSQILDSGETKRDFFSFFFKPKEGCLDMLLPTFHSYLTEIVRF